MKEQYMFGSDMLVAPVLYEDAMEREVTSRKAIPGRCFMTVWPMREGQTVSVKAPLSVIPVFLRDGSCRELIGRI